MDRIRLSAQFIVVDKDGNEYKMSEFTQTGEDHSPEERYTYFLENGREAEKINQSEFRVKRTGESLQKNP